MLELLCESCERGAAAAAAPDDVSSAMASSQQQLRLLPAAGAVFVQVDGEAYKLVNPAWLRIHHEGTVLLVSFR